MDIALFNRVILRWNTSYFRTQRYVFLTTLIAGGILVINILALWVYPDTPDPFLPLHYTAYFGVDYLGFFEELYYIPLLGFMILLLNTLLARMFIRRNLVLSGALSTTSLLVQVIVTMFLFTTLLRF